MPAETRVSNQYTSEGVVFPGNPEDSRPVVKSAPGEARSGTKVGGFNYVGSCECFHAARLKGVLTNSANSVSAYVGMLDVPASPGQTMKIRMRAYDDGGNEVAT